MVRSSLATADEVVQRSEVEEGVPLWGDVPVERYAREIPAAFSLKGMFFTPYVRALAHEWPEIAPSLLAGPPEGRYQSFSAYPSRDYLRLFDRVARKSFRDVAARQAYRLLARREIQSFGATTLGRVALGLLSSPTGALVKYQECYGLLCTGPSARAEVLATNRVELTLESYFGSAEYVVGVLEGLVLHFGASPRIFVETRANGSLVFDVHVRPAPRGV